MHSKIGLSKNVVYLQMNLYDVGTLMNTPQWQLKT